LKKIQMKSFKTSKEIFDFVDWWQNCGAEMIGARFLKKNSARKHYYTSLFQQFQAIKRIWFEAKRL
jgi:hypothetical protein